MLSLLFIMLVLDFVGQGCSLTLMMTERPQCFQMDKARDIPLTFMYEAVEANSNPFELSLYYGSEVKKEMQVMAKSLVEMKGAVKYMTDNDGEYTLCMSQTMKKATDPPARLKMVVYSGYDVVHKDVHSTDADGSRDEHHYDIVNQNLQILNDMIDLTMTEADYQKVRELDHHIDTLAMNSAAIWWPVCQILMLVGIAVFQMHHLKGFFSRLTRGLNS